MQITIKVPNAQKWTEERVTGHLQFIMQDSYGSEVSYLGEALMRQGLYKQIWSYWKQIFAGNDNIIEDMLIIETNFEVRLCKAAMNKEIPVRLAALILKNNHDWQENPKPEAAAKEKEKEKETEVQARQDEYQPYPAQTYDGKRCSGMMFSLPEGRYMYSYPGAQDLMLRLETKEEAEEAKRKSAELKAMWDRQARGLI